MSTPRQISFTVLVALCIPALPALKSDREAQDNVRELQVIRSYPDWEDDSGPPSDLALPVGCAYINDRIYVTDANLSHIVVMDQDGNELRTISRAGSGPGELQTPGKIVADKDHSSFWVLDDLNASEFDYDGNYITRVRNLVGSRTIAFLPTGDVALCGIPSSRRGAISMYRRDGEFVRDFAGSFLGGNDGRAQFLHGESLVASLGELIWQVPRKFSFIRVFSNEGSLLFERRFSEPALVRNDELNAKLLHEKVGGRSNPYPLNYSLVASDNYVWILCQGLDLARSKRGSRQLILKYSRTGDLKTMYENTTGLITDIAIIREESPALIIAIEAMNHQVVWLSESPESSQR